MNWAVAWYTAVSMVQVVEEQICCHGRTRIHGGRTILKNILKNRIQESGSYCIITMVAVVFDSWSCFQRRTTTSWTCLSALDVLADDQPKKFPSTRKIKSPQLGTSWFLGVIFCCPQLLMLLLLQWLWQDKQWRNKDHEVVYVAFVVMIVAGETID